jgi:hypothetical protein
MGMDKKEVKDEFSGKDELTFEQLERLKKSQEQCRNGNTFTHEEVLKIIMARITSGTALNSSK